MAWRLQYEGEFLFQKVPSTSAMALREPPPFTRSSLQQVRGIPPLGLHPTLEPGTLQSPRGAELVTAAGGSCPPRGP